MRILVVEDEDSIASFVVKGLRAEGHSVERAANAADAIALTRAVLRCFARFVAPSPTCR